MEDDIHVASVDDGVASVDIRVASVDDIYAGLSLSRPAAGERRARVSLGMVTSADGAAAVGGVSGPLGGAADRVAFGRLRAACDAVVVGAGTVRAEDYAAPTGDAARRAERTAAGLAPIPTLVVVSGRLDLPADHRVFSSPAARVVVVTHAEAPTDRRAALSEVAEVVTIGDHAVDLPALVGWCHEEGLDAVLCEGGPALAGAFAAADLVDELFVTVSPTLVGGHASRLVVGPELDPPTDLDLVGLQRHHAEVLLRYRVRRRDG